MTGWEPLALYAQARRAGSTASGYYNHNVPVDAPGGTVLVRIPVPRADRMDLRIWPEPDVLRVVAAHVGQVPALRHASAEPRFQIHEFVPGSRLDDLAPRGTPLPAELVPSVLRLVGRLAAVGLDRLPPLPTGWPADGECPGFARTLSAFTRRVYAEHRPSFGALLRALGVPDAPLDAVEAAWPALTSRPFQLLHADLHRRNMIVSPRGVIFLDWELALWGDPLYELAVHVNKMTYLPDELRSLLSGWEAVVRPGPGWRDELRAYLRHEQVKSAIVHTVRYAKEIVADGTAEPRRALLVEKLTADLNAARPVWGRHTPLSAPEVRHAVTSLAPRPA